MNNETDYFPAAGFHAIAFDPFMFVIECERYAGGNDCDDGDVL